jgi:hypothetical protein
MADALDEGKHEYGQGDVPSFSIDIFSSVIFYQSYYIFYCRFRNSKINFKIQNGNHTATADCNGNLKNANK